MAELSFRCFQRLIGKKLKFMRAPAVAFSRIFQFNHNVILIILNSNNFAHTAAAIIEQVKRHHIAHLQRLVYPTVVVPPRRSFETWMPHLLALPPACGTGRVLRQPSFDAVGMKRVPAAKAQRGDLRRIVARFEVAEAYRALYG